MTLRGNGPVVMPATVADAILAHARADAPYEACGLLVGQAWEVRRAVPTSNHERLTTRYAVPPDEHLAVLRAARAEGLQVIGAYHSHPRTAAEPSPTDLASAFADFLFVIAAAVPAPHVRAWRLVDGNFAELLLVRT